MITISGKPESFVGCYVNYGMTSKKQYFCDVVPTHPNRIYDSELSGNCYYLNTSAYSTKIHEDKILYKKFRTEEEVVDFLKNNNNFYNIVSVEPNTLKTVSEIIKNIDSYSETVVISIPAYLCSNRIVSKQKGKVKYLCQNTEYFGPKKVYISDKIDKFNLISGRISYLIRDSSVTVVDDSDIVNCYIEKDQLKSFLNKNNFPKNMEIQISNASFEEKTDFFQVSS